MKRNSFKIGIDLALRNTGVCIMEGEEVFDCFVYSPSEDYMYEEIINKYVNFFENMLKFKIPIDDIEFVNIEGLSFNSLSGSKDILAGIHWSLRALFQRLIPGKFFIIPVQTWRSPLFNKDERKMMKDAKKLLVEKYKNKRTLQNENKDDYEELKRKADIKHQTYLKIPAHHKDKIFDIYLEKKYNLYDMCDAYWIANFKK